MKMFSLEQINYDTLVVDEWLSLFGNCFGQRDFVNVNWYNWFNLGYNKNKVFVIKDGPRMIASYGLYPIDIVFDSKNFQGYLCHNVMTDPEYGGMGLFTKLGKYSIDELKDYVELNNYPRDIRSTLRDAVTYLWVEHLADTSGFGGTALHR